MTIPEVKKLFIQIVAKNNLKLLMRKIIYPKHIWNINPTLNCKLEWDLKKP